MSNRSMLELNHDNTPLDDDSSLLAWARSMVRYLGSGDPAELPRGVTFFNMRHHSEDCPLGEPPRGWENNKPQTCPVVQLDKDSDGESLLSVANEQVESADDAGSSPARETPLDLSQTGVGVYEMRDGREATVDREVDGKWHGTVPTLSGDKDSVRWRQDGTHDCHNDPSVALLRFLRPLDAPDQPTIRDINVGGDTSWLDEQRPTDAERQLQRVSSVPSTRQIAASAKEMTHEEFCKYVEGLQVGERVIETERSGMHGSLGCTTRREWPHGNVGYARYWAYDPAEPYFATRGYSEAGVRFTPLLDSPPRAAETGEEVLSDYDISTGELPVIKKKSLPAGEGEK